MKTYLIKDVLEAYIESTNGKKYFYGLTTESSITRNMTQELIRAGIGSKVVGTLSDSEGYTIDITTGLFYEDTIELQIGEEFKSVSDVKVQKISVDDGEVTATEEEVAGNAIELESTAVPKDVKLQLRTIAYDNKTQEVVAEIFWIFDRVSPSGGFTQTFGMGQNNVQEISFRALIPEGETSYGRYVIVPRETSDSGTGGDETGGDETGGGETGGGDQG